MTAMDEQIITVESVSKRYRLGRLWSSPYAPLQRLARRAGAACQRRWNPALRSEGIPPSPGSARGGRPSIDILWALRDVNFSVARGEVLGIVGRNGAGKSTLLKILSRITPPSAGRVVMRGRVASLLEVGTGFHPELTGRDNIYLNGSMLGMTHSEIRRRFGAIVDFAGVGRFLDTPVKRYSSGMYVRLAFAVAAHLDPEILLVDEVLAVGDVAFQQKCLGKMQTIADSGRTVLFVSHNMAAVRHLCTRGLALHDGRVLALGDVDEVVDAYLARMRDESQGEGGSAFSFPVAPPEPRPPAWVRRVEILDEQGRPPESVATGDAVRLRLHFECAQKSVVTPRVGISTPSGTCVLLFAMRASADSQVECEPGRHHVDVVVPKLPLSTGIHVLGAALRMQGEGFVHEALYAGEFKVSPRDVYGTGWPPTVRGSLVMLPHSWDVPADDSGIRAIEHD